MARQLFTANHGGISIGNFASFNNALHVGDLLENVTSNRAKLQKLVSASYLQFMNQVHGNEVVRVSHLMETPPTADAIITTEKEIGLVVMVADCAPVLVDGGAVVGAIHVGRRGLTNGIVGKTIQTMKDLGASELVAQIGPMICGACYEVGAEMYREIVKDFPEADAGFRKIDIRKGVVSQLAAMGVRVENFTRCTREDENYFSFRRSNLTGRQCGVILL
jgi:polyphenol oxidase